ncbi:MAG: glucose 1-dehydrogenase [Deltaproteobacteria bacterium]|nr:glucose 1-dehydrogenase [Deltaproteobacteria bacterium]MBW2044165.1 glucose 1-dehydrogenase [Deltaproteobacteria bacterium]MBW2300550.1 glucose 1-dehydrogenase [Deltaproteobacteria bacterium]
MKANLEKLFSLDGKVSVVTGGNGGIGKGIARGLAAAGSAIVIAARNEAKTANAQREIKEEFGVEVLGVKVNVLHEREIDAMVKKVVNRFGKIDILVNNAGMAINKLPHEMSTAEWDENINTNLRSVFICSNTVYPVMKKSGQGKIINIGSMFALFGAPALPAYAASKGGVVQLTKSLAIAWAADNIQVNAIMPGFINTELSAGGKRDIPGLEKMVVARTPAGRWGEPEDCAGAAVFLASSAADFITGATLAVDGGYSVM